MTLGEVTREAWIVTLFGPPLPHNPSLAAVWRKLSPEEREAWEEAANAAVNAFIMRDARDE